MVVGYCRVSSKKQLEGYGLEAQIEEIKSKYENAIIYQEQYTGTKTDRPIFNEVLRDLKEGDTLVVTKLDRLARNTVEGIQIVEDLFKRNVAVHVLNVGLLENTSMGKFFLTTLLAVAEMERNTILERMNSGKEVAKARAEAEGKKFKEGRPKAHSKENIDRALKLLETMSYREVVELTKISKSTLIRAKRERGLI